MEISEQELRSMIRDAIARHSGGAPPTVPPVAAGSPSHSHASHGLLVVAASADGACVIEPAVRCNQCGFCKSLGH